MEVCALKTEKGMGGCLMPLHICCEGSSETYVVMILERTWLLSIGFAVDVFPQGISFVK
jgi:hypothetical protein